MSASMSASATRSLTARHRVSARRGGPAGGAPPPRRLIVSAASSKKYEPLFGAETRPPLPPSMDTMDDGDEDNGGVACAIAYADVDNDAHPTSSLLKAGGVIENKHTTGAECSSPRPRLCVSIHTQGTPCSDLVIFSWEGAFADCILHQIAMSACSH
jgi:hypothetical protein